MGFTCVFTVTLYDFRVTACALTVFVMPMCLSNGYHLCWRQCHHQCAHWEKIRSYNNGFARFIDELVRYNPGPCFEIRQDSVFPNFFRVWYTLSRRSHGATMHSYIFLLDFFKSIIIHATLSLTSKVAEYAWWVRHWTECDTAIHVSCVIHFSFAHRCCLCMSWQLIIRIFWDILRMQNVSSFVCAAGDGS